MTDQRLFHLALEALHESAGAHFGVYGEWRLPASYGNARAEYTALRQAAIVADRSDRSRFIVSGTDALPVLDATFAGRMNELEEGRATRTARLGADGQIEDLVLVSRTGGIVYVVAGEPGQRDATRHALEAAVGDDWNVRIDDRTETTCSIAVSGPGAAAVVAEHLSDALPPRLPTLHATAFEFHGFRATAARASETGEDGFEFMLAPAVALHLLETLVAAGVPMAGRTALESARVEACIPAMDPDLATGLTPAQARLETLLDIEDVADGPILMPLLLEGDSLVATGQPVLDGERTIGEVRSCVEAYSLDAVAALAVIDQQHAHPGSTFEIDGRNATVVAGPLYRRR